MKTITLAKGSKSVVLPCPKFQYQSVINLAIKIHRSPLDGTLKIWDNLRTHDYRTCLCKFILNETQMINLHSFLSDHDVRCEDIELRLSEKSFFPFGPDLGNEGIFIVQVIEDNDRSGRKLKPLNHYEFSMKMLLRNAPSYTMPVKNAQGKFTIGTVTGLPYPIDIKPEFTSGWKIDLTNSGAPSCIDEGSSVNYYSTEFTLEGNSYNIGRLIHYIQNSARTSDISIIAPMNSNLFGCEIGNGSLITQLMSNILTVEQGTANMFKITMNLALKK